MAESNNTNTGMGLAGWLTIVFVVLKLNPGGHLTTAVADWSWWWVLSPIWITLGLVVIILAGAAVVIKVIDVKDKKKRAARYNSNRFNRR